MAIANELTINTSVTAVDMANSIFGPGVTVVGATYTGDPLSAGIYSGATTTIPGITPTDTGVILSTGRVADFTNSSGTTNTNTSAGTSYDSAGVNGDAQLNAIAGMATFDGSILTADFIPDGDFLTMQFVFSSEEYPEYVSGGVNDSFGVWVNGNFVPVSITVAGNVAIDEVNGGKNENLYRDNTGDMFNTEMDGFTYVLSFKAPVTAGAVNSIKIGIADGGDSVYDSNLLIMGDSVQTVTLAMDDKVNVIANSSRTFDILGNDNATTGALTITQINGTNVVVGQTVTLNSGQQVRLNADNTVTVFANGVLGAENFSYTISNGTTTDVGYVTINTASAAVLDGIVSGTSGDDTIQVGYLGDPDGDKIDNSDGQGVGGTTGDADYVMAGAGNDSIVANLGNDVIYAGSGNDTVFGGSGDDWASLGTGNDSFGTYGADSAGNDTVYGGAGNDSIIGGGGNDVLFGDAGKDTLSGGVGSDTMYGGADADQFDISNDHAGDTIVGGETTTAGGTDNDLIAFSNFSNTSGVNLTYSANEAGTYAYTTGATGSFTEIEAINATLYNDTINATATTSGVNVTTNAGNDSVTGGSGKDTIDSGSGADVVTAGGGDDLVYGGSGNDTITGEAGNDQIETGLGEDFVTAGLGDDYVINTGGYDYISTNEGNDTVVGAGSVASGDGNDRIDFSTSAPESLPNQADGGAGNDTIIGGNATDDVVYLSAGNDTFDGGANSAYGDWVSARDLGQAANINISTGTATFGANTTTFTNVEDAQGSAFGDTITGDANANEIYADGGNDTVSAGAGNDTVGGGNGADLLTGGAGSDRIDGDADADTIYGGAGDNIFGGETTTAGGTDNDTLILNFADVQSISYGGGNNEAGTVTFTAASGGGTLSFSEIENIAYAGAVDGTAGSDTMNAGYTDAQGDIVDGSDGLNDTILGYAGNDTIDARLGNDLVYGGTGDDRVDGFDGNDTIYGDTGNDQLTGHNGTDLIYGGDGNDTIDDTANTGESGTIFGGLGNDTLYFTAATNGQFTVQGGENSGDFDLISGYYLPTNLNVTFTGNEAGTMTTAGGATVTFTEIEGVTTGTGNDTVNAAASSVDQKFWLIQGDDSLVAGTGNDTVDAGAGNDTLVMGLGNDVVTAGDGNDSAQGGAGNDNLSGDAGNDILVGGTGADWINGGADADVLYGAADDTVFGGETVTTGTDNDTLVLNYADVQSISYGGGNNEAGTVTFTAASGGGTLTFSEIENIAYVGAVDGTAGNDTMNVGYTDAQGDIIDGADGLNDTIFGYGGDDLIIAGTGNDTVFGGTGNDEVQGAGGDDTLFGDDGNDFVNGGAGNDIGYGGAGDDSFATGNAYGAGNDTFQGGAGWDTAYVYSDAGQVTIEGGENVGDRDVVWLQNLSTSTGANVTYTANEAATFGFAGGAQGTWTQTEVLWASGNNDTINASATTGGESILGMGGDDQIIGGSGNDYVTGDAGNDTVTSGGGNDTLIGGTGNDSLSGGAGIDSIDGGDGRDILIGGTGVDSLTGGADADVIYGGAGDVVVGGETTTSGGTDNDTLVLNYADVQSITYGGGNNEAGTVTFTAASGGGTLSFSEIENIVYAGPVDGTAGNDTMMAGYTDLNGDQIDGTDGLNDTIFGYAGNDWIEATNGNDTVFGGLGNDTVYGGLGSNILYGDEGDDFVWTDNSNDTLSGLNDTIYGGVGNDTLYGRYGNDLIYGGTGNDVMHGGPGQDTVYGEDGDDQLNGGVDAAADLFYGGAGNDDLRGDDGNDSLYGGDGNDLTYGGNDADLVQGGIGDDTLYGDAGADTLLGEAGNDVLFGGDGNDSIDGGAGADQIFGGANDDVTTGGADNDALSGGAGNDTLSGNEGDDFVEGDQGNDLLQGDLGNDILYGGDDSDTVDGGEGNDTLYGDSGNDSLNGGSDDDFVHGGAGNDTLAGGGGSDTLRGLEGDDRFILADGFGTDEIVGGEDAGDGDIDVLDASATTEGSEIHYDSDEAGQFVTGSGDVATFAEIEHLVLGSGRDSVEAGNATGGINIDLGAGNDVVYAGSGVDTILAGTGEDIVQGGQGNDIIDLGMADGARDTVNMVNGDGSDTITGFEAPIDNGDGTFTGRDLVEVSNITDAQGNPVNVDDVTVSDDGNGNAVLTFPNGESMTLVGISPGAVSSPAALIAMGIPPVVLDYIVEGDAGDNYIDAGYTGDPEGDMIDANDNLAGNNDDLVTAGAGNDSVYTGAGNDTVYGEDGNDLLQTGLGADLLYGGAGNDRFFTENGSDTVYGGDGDDSAYASLDGDLVYGGAGNDFLQGGGYPIGPGDTLYGDTGNDTMMGYGGSDQMYGGADNDLFLVQGPIDNDTIEGGEAGSDFDRVDLSSQGIGVRVGFTGNEAGGIDNGLGQQIAFSEIEAFTLTAQDDVFEASGTTNGTSVNAGDGADTLQGGSGNDSLFGEAGNDSITAGAGDDSVDAGTGNDYVWAGTGNDTVYGGLGDDTIGGWTGDNLLDGGMGNDTISAEGGNDTLLGNEGNDLIFGGAGNDSIRGGDGNDIINAGEGVDTVFGDADADTFVVQNAMGSNTIYGGEAGNDFDTVDLLNHTGAVSITYSGAEAGLIDGGTSGTTTFSQIENLILTLGDDTVDASADSAGIYVSDYGGNDTVLGGSGNDTVYSGSGNDLVGAGAGDDRVYGGSGDDTISVVDGFGTDDLRGGETGQTTGDVLDASGMTADAVLDLSAGADNEDGTLTSGGDTLTFAQIEQIELGSGNDSVIGSTGADSVSAGDGNDTLSGGAGNDIFDLGASGGDIDTVVFGDGAGDDIISSFEAPTDNGDGTFTGLDQLDVSGLTDASGNPVNTADVVVSDDGLGNAVLTFPNGESITLIGIDPAAINSPAALVAMGIPVAPNLIVDGTSGNDVMGAGFVDIHGDQIDGTDGDDDTIMGYDGNDTVQAGAGNDQVYGGTGDDVLAGGAGNDMLEGGAGNDSLVGDAGDDTLYGGAGGLQETIYGGTGNDQVYSGTSHDYVDLGEGNDYVHSSGGNDTVYGGLGNDTVLTDWGNDQIYGGLGDDSIDTGWGNDSLFGDAGNDYLSGNVGDDTLYGGTGIDRIYGGEGNDSIDTGAGDDVASGDDGDDTLHGLDGNDILYGGAGNDSLFGWGDNDSLLGGAGDDMVDGDAGNDSLDGGAGNDTIVGDEGNDTLFGGEGNDELYSGTEDDSLDGGLGDDTAFGGEGNDTVAGGLGNDQLYGNEGDDQLSGGEGNDNLRSDVGNDTLDAGEGDDTLIGDSGNDVFYGGDGNDVMSGRDDRDTFFGGIGDTVDGGEGGDDYDVLDLTAYGHPATNIIYDPLNHENGTVEFLDVDGNVVGTMEFTNIESVVACFTPGSMILTEMGEMAVEDLLPGDRVLTRDNGYQTIRWAGRRDLSHAELIVEPRFNPVFIAKGALGAGLPERDMMVSPQHRMLITGPRAELLFGEHEVLVAAKHLVGMAGVEQRVVKAVSYVHILFDAHEIVRADGAWSESFQPGKLTLEGLGAEQRAEILALFPELAQGADMPAARLTLKAKEARVLIKT